MEFISEQEIILASNSPRRKELLSMVGIPFTAVTSHVIENDKPEQLSLMDYAQSLAKNKAITVAKKFPNSIVIGADTVVGLGDRHYPKPRDHEEATQFLKQLSGQVHAVITGVCICYQDKVECFANVTNVKFYPLDDALINTYVASGDPLDKAGAYGIQTTGSLFVDWIDGDYYSVMGLPIATLTKKLRKLGLISLKEEVGLNDS